MPPDSTPAPLVWVVASHRALGNEHRRPQPYTVVDEGGTRAAVALGLQPVSYPCVPPAHLAPLLDTVDGVVLGGSATNVSPRHYGQAQVVDGELDAERESVSLPLVRLCVERRVPLIAFCRGSHEVNVAFGGTLHQHLQARGGGVVHWEDPSESLERQYAERHDVTAVPGGALAGIVGTGRFPVSSLHSQGVDRLGDGLVVEARADDGLVEAFRWHQADRFAWGFQFHPEWGHAHRDVYARIMATFVTACRQRRAERGARIA